MKTTKVGNTVFHHQLNFEGNVEIIVKPNKVGRVPASDIVGEYYVVNVPFDDMKKLVLDGLRNKIIQRTTEASDKEFEEWILRNL